MAFQRAKVLLSAVELSLFSELARGSLDAEVLRRRLGLDVRGARDFFDALVALGLLDRRHGRYSNTPETDLFLDRTKPSYVGAWLERANDQGYPSWGSLTEALRTGQPQTETQGSFALTYGDPARLRGALEAMTGHNLGVAKAVSRKFSWGEYRTFIDVGTAQGALPVQVALAHRHLSGGGFDLPPVGSFFEEYVASFGLGDRLRFYAGDFFTGPLPPADVLVMGHVLHDWSLDQKRALLDKAYQALAPGGALIVYDYLIDDQRRENASGLLMSLNMLVNTVEGFDYTGADCLTWMREVGFSEPYVEHLGGPQSMVIGTK
jgi:hypothetical protein